MFDQDGFEIRCEWGEHGVALLAPTCDVVVVGLMVASGARLSWAFHRRAWM